MASVYSMENTARKIHVFGTEFGTLHLHTQIIFVAMPNTMIMMTIIQNKNLSYHLFNLRKAHFYIYMHANLANFSYNI